MNLINDPWIPVLRMDGTQERIVPWQIAEVDNPVIDIAAPRPDFQGALYQFLIGLLQTSFAPEDQDEWLQYWEKSPDAIVIKEKFGNFSSAFELFNPNSYSFLQDNSIELKKPESISQLLIGEPGVNTVKNNQDHFIHAGEKLGFCEACSAITLYVLSLNGPPGGAGHMSGLIGNGPVVTLAKIDGNTLWQNLWINILTEYDFGEKATKVSDDIFPWMGNIKTSEKCKTKECQDGCDKCSVFPKGKSHLHVFWGMARRIRLIPLEKSGCCSICGCESRLLVEKYATRPNGIRYMGGWSYPLSPRKFYGKDRLPEPLRGNQTLKFYPDWLGITFEDDNQEIKASQAINHFLDEKLNYVDSLKYRLHCYFYDMEPGQAKARCWYEQQMPIIHVAPQYRPLFIHFTANLINAARDVVKELRTQVKAAWFSRPKDVKGDTSMVDSMFWGTTEPDFYQVLFVLASQPDDTRLLPTEVAQSWLNTLCTKAKETFDYWVLEGDAEDMDMKRITKARRELEKKLKTIKSLKDLDQVANAKTEVA